MSSRKFTYFFSSICGCHSWLFRYPFCQTATVRTEIFHAETPNSVLAFVFQSIHLHVVSNTPSNHALKSASLRCFIQMHYVRNHLSVYKPKGKWFLFKGLEGVNRLDKRFWIVGDGVISLFTLLIFKRLPSQMLSNKCDFWLIIIYMGTRRSTRRECYYNALRNQTLYIAIMSPLHANYH